MQASLYCGNHPSTVPRSRRLRSKRISVVVNGRAILFDMNRAAEIRRLPISPFGIVEELKFRIIHYLSFARLDAHGATNVNADTDFLRAPPVELGHVIKVVLLRVISQQQHGAAARIVLSKIDASEAYRQVPVDQRAPLFLATP